MNTARDAVAAAVLNDKIYVCGGFDNDTLKTVEVYDPETDRYFHSSSTRILVEIELYCINTSLYSALLLHY